MPHLNIYHKMYHKIEHTANVKIQSNGNLEILASPPHANTAGVAAFATGTQEVHEVVRNAEVVGTVIVNVCTKVALAVISEMEVKDPRSEAETTDGTCNDSAH